MQRVAALLAASLVLAGPATAFAAGTLHFVVMSPADPQADARKYEALGAYLRSVNPLLGDIKLQVAKNYPEAAGLFAAGDAEGMFCGSFVAAVFIAKGLARPVARALAADGSSTYRTSVVAKRGGAPFTGLADFRGRRVAYCLLASAGDVFARSLLGPGEEPGTVFTPVPVDSHRAALAAVASGAADYAVVKSTVFTPGEYPGLAEVGSDAREHPDTTLIMPNAVFERFGAMVSRALLGLEADTGEKAEAVRKAGVSPKTFDFAF